MSLYRWLHRETIPSDCISGSIGKEVYETENHLHNNDICMGAAAAANGEIHVADRIGPGIAAFSLTSGNDAYGSWVQVLGSSDSPVQAGMTSLDAGSIMVIDANDIAPFNVQFAVGESAGLAALISAGNYTDSPFKAATNNIDSGIHPVRSRRIDAGTKVWARCICVGQNAKVIKFYVVMHEYEF